VIVERADLHRLSGRVTMVDGGFDPLHAGHVAYFTAAARLGRPVLCNVQADRYTNDAKRRPTLLPQDQRVTLLDALKPISHVHLCTTTTDDVLRQLRPAVYAKGADWRGRLPSEQLETCRALGIHVRYLDISVPVSSTQLARAFRDGLVPSDSMPELDVRHVAQAPYRAVLTSHADRYLSGVARFNALLADRLGAFVVSAGSPPDELAGPVLVSVKLADCTERERDSLVEACESLHRRGVAYDVFFHAFDASRAERRILRRSRQVFAGNGEIAGRVRTEGADPVTLWCPSLLDGYGAIDPSAFTVFSFGMAHKLQVGYFDRLRSLLEESRRPYQVLVSTAFHEKASFGEIGAAEGRMKTAFGERAHLLGFLSDDAVRYFLARAELFCAFYPGGVRANNTTAFAALEAGVPLLTNLDDRSPQWLEHGATVLDVARAAPADFEPHELRRIGDRGRTAAEEHASWPLLLRALADHAQDPSDTQPASLSGVVADTFTDALAPPRVPAIDLGR
jgi:glycerol-3-phosphate cytidylyltransferase